MRIYKLLQNKQIFIKIFMKIMDVQIHFFFNHLYLLQQCLDHQPEEFDHWHHFSLKINTI